MEIKIGDNDKKLVDFLLSQIEEIKKDIDYRMGQSLMLDHNEILKYRLEYKERVKPLNKEIERIYKNSVYSVVLSEEEANHIIKDISLP